MQKINELAKCNVSAKTSCKENVLYECSYSTLYTLNVYRILYIDDDLYKCKYYRIIIQNHV